LGGRFPNDFGCSRRIIDHRRLGHDVFGPNRFCCVVGLVGVIGQRIVGMVGVVGIVGIVGIVEVYGVLSNIGITAEPTGQ
jgi:hypothetical protein